MNREGGRQKGRNDDLILEVSLVCETAQIPAPVVGVLSIRFTRNMSKEHPDAGSAPPVGFRPERTAGPRCPRQTLLSIWNLPCLGLQDCTT